MFGGLTVKVKWLWWRDKTWPTVTLVARLANWLLTFFKKRKIYLFTVFPRIIAGEIFFFFAPNGGDYLREGNYSRKVVISKTCIAHWKSCTRYFTLSSRYLLKIIISNELNMGFLSVPDLFLWLIFNFNILSVRAWVVTDQFLIIYSFIFIINFF